MSETQIRSAQDLWRDYHFLTKEMVKFLGKQDLDLFYQILDQRDQLQKLIDAHPSAEFAATPAGRQLIADIQRDNQFITLKLQGLIHQTKHHHTITSAYNRLGAATTGRRGDWQG